MTRYLICGGRKKEDRAEDEAQAKDNNRLTDENRELKTKLAMERKARREAEQRLGEVLTVTPDQQVVLTGVSQTLRAANGVEVDA